MIKDKFYEKLIITIKSVINPDQNPSYISKLALISLCYTTLTKIGYFVDFT